MRSYASAHVGRGGVGRLVDGRKAFEGYNGDVDGSCGEDGLTDFNGKGRVFAEAIVCPRSGGCHTEANCGETSTGTAPTARN